MLKMCCLARQMGAQCNFAGHSTLRLAHASCMCVATST